MAFTLRNSGSVVTPSKLTIRQSGVNRNIRRLSVWHDGALRTVKEFVSPLSVSISPASAFGFTVSTSPARATTSVVSAQPSGGIGPFTYSWALISSSGGQTPMVTSSSSASTTFYQDNVAPYTGATAQFRVIVTDDFGSTASADIIASFENFGDFS